MLLDACPRCGGGLDFFEGASSAERAAERRATDRLDCRRCGFDLTRAPGDPPGPSILPGYLAFQRFFADHFHWSDEGRRDLVLEMLYRAVLRLTAIIAKHPDNLEAVRLFPSANGTGQNRFFLNEQSCGVRHALLSQTAELLYGLRGKPSAKRRSQAYLDQLNPPMLRAALLDFVENDLPESVRWCRTKDGREDEKAL